MRISCVPHFLATSLVLLYQCDCIVSRLLQSKTQQQQEWVADAISSDTTSPVATKAMRFSKVVFPTDVSVPDGFLPLDSDNYPLSESDYNVLRLSQCPSVILPNDYEVHQSVEELIGLIGGLPRHPPNNNINDPFWDTFLSIVDFQILRRERGNEPSSTVLPWLELPTLWQNYTLNDVAIEVHNEVSSTQVALFFSDSVFAMLALLTLFPYCFFFPI